MHKNPYKDRFIAVSSKCSTKTLSILPTKLLTHILKARSSEVLRSSLLKKQDQLDVDPRKFQRVIGRMKSPNSHQCNFYQDIRSFHA